MNVFVLALNLPNEHRSKVSDELLKMAEVYPHLGTDTLREWQSTCGTIISACMHTTDDLSIPRRYVSQNKSQVVLYSGLPVNPAGAFPAHQADALAAHWDQLDHALEGMYSLARLTDAPLQIDIQTDILGLENVFYFNQGDIWLFSNSVHLIERIYKPCPLDPVGMSLFLAMGWVGSDRTLRSGINTIPAGQRWTWRKGDHKPRQHAYYPASKLACQPVRKLNNAIVKKLADDLMQPLTSLRKDFNTITCALTGGRDSRLITALLVNANVPAHYYTYGNPSGDDATIAKQICQKLNLSYEVMDTDASDIMTGWDTAAQQLARRGDGMYPLQLITGTVAFSNRKLNQLNIRMWGAGGEIARGYYSSPNLILSRPSIIDIQNYLVHRSIFNNGHLMRQEGISLTQEYIHQFVSHCADNGFKPLDILDAFYTYQRVGRRAGNNMHTSMPFHDSFSPFCTRAFIEAAFSVSALQRCTEPLHYTLTRLLSPELHKLPYLKHPWSTQSAALCLLNNLAKTRLNKLRRKLRHFKRAAQRNNTSTTHLATDTMFDRLDWLEEKRETIRGICLDQKDSPIWEIADRPLFERITSSKCDPAERSRNLKRIFHIATLFYYDTYNK